jgi:general secretion pathway protein D
VAFDRFKHALTHRLALVTERASVVGVTILAGSLLAGCMTSSEQSQGPPSDRGIIDQIRAFDLKPRFTERVRSAPDVNVDPGPRPVTYYGETLGPGAQFMNPAADPETTGALPDRRVPGGDQGYQMNFEDAPVQTVAKAVLGDILGIGYTIDPRVKGTVNLSSGRPVPKNDLLYVLESALRVSGIALVRNGRDYRLIPAADAVGSAAIEQEAGYGISVIPLQFVSSQTLTKLLENFSTKAGMVRAEPSRNLLIVQGNGPDRRAALETALSFDADWMRGQSVGIYPVSNSTPEPVIAELERIIDSGEGGLSQNVVKLQPIGRQNAILVVTQKPELLDRVSTWINRLDRSGGPGTGVKVYRMRYGDARQAAALLNDIFLGGGGNGLNSPTNQLAPGSAIAGGFGRGAGGGAQMRNAALAQPTSAAPTFETRFADASGGGRNLPVSASPPSSPRANAVTTGAAEGALLANVRIAPDAINNSLLIYANQENYRLIERALHQIDRPQMQVAIEATIAEITLNDELRYGVQFYLKSKNVGLNPDEGSLLNTISKAAGSALIGRVFPGFNFLIGSETDPRVILDALRTRTGVKVLSTPSLVVVDNQFATLQVGDEIPITTRTAQSVDVPTAPVVNSIDYRNTGVILRVAPRINANGNVLLDIEQEISAVANTSTAATLTPTVTQRRVRSSIAVASGQTVLLGGLISEREDRGRAGVPGLEQVPFVGELFSHNDVTVRRTELVIFIRPQIIRNGIDASRIAEELRTKMRGIRARVPETSAKVSSAIVRK